MAGLTPHSDGIGVAGIPSRSTSLLCSFADCKSAGFPLCQAHMDIMRKKHSAAAPPPTHKTSLLRTTGARLIPDPDPGTSVLPKLARKTAPNSRSKLTKSAGPSGFPGTGQSGISQTNHSLNRTSRHVSSSQDHSRNGNGYTFPVMRIETAASQSDLQKSRGSGSHVFSIGAGGAGAPDTASSTLPGASNTKPPGDYRPRDPFRLERETATEPRAGSRTEKIPPSTKGKTVENLSSASFYGKAAGASDSGVPKAPPPLPVGDKVATAKGEELQATPSSGPLSGWFRKGLVSQYDLDPPPSAFTGSASAFGLGQTSEVPPTTARVENIDAVRSETIPTINATIPISRRSTVFTESNCHRALRARNKLEVLDFFIYRQDSTSLPLPTGVVVGPLPRLKKRSHPPKPHEGPVFAHIDPSVHWCHAHSEAWHQSKQKEIEARGGRKANFGAAATRMAARRREELLGSPAGQPNRAAGSKRTRDIVLENADDNTSSELAQLRKRLDALDQEIWMRDNEATKLDMERRIRREREKRGPGGQAYTSGGKR